MSFEETTPSVGTPTDDEKKWVMLGIFSVLLFSVFGAILFYALKKGDDMPWAHVQLKRNVNFALSWMIWFFISFLLMGILVGLITTPILGIVLFILVVKNAIGAANGKEPSFPLTINFIK